MRIEMARDAGIQQMPEGATSSEWEADQPTSKRGRSWPVAAAVLVLVLVAGGLFWFLAKDGGEAQAEQTGLAVKT